MQDLFCSSVRTFLLAVLDRWSASMFNMFCSVGCTWIAHRLWCFPRCLTSVAIHVALALEHPGSSDAAHVALALVLRHMLPWLKCCATCCIGSRVAPQSPGQLLKASGQLLKASCELLKASCKLLKASCKLLKASGKLLKASGQLLNVSGQLLKVSGQLLKASGQLLKSQASFLKSQARFLKPQVSFLMS